MLQESFWAVSGFGISWSEVLISRELSSSARGRAADRVLNSATFLGHAEMLIDGFAAIQFSSKSLILVTHAIL
jgi:hypothetical protein